MLFPKKMVKTNIIVHTSILEETVDALSDAEMMQVDPVEDILSEEVCEHLDSQKTPSRHSKLLDIEVRIERLFDIFDSLFHEETSMLADLLSGGPEPTKVDRLDYKRLLSRSNGALEAVEALVLKLHERLSGTTDEIMKLEEKRAQISLLTPMDFPMDYLGKGYYTFTRVGTSDDVDEMKRALGGIDDVTFIHAPTDLPEVPNVVVVIGLLEVEKDVRKALRGKIFNEVQLPELKGRPKEVLKEINRSVRKSSATKDEILDEIEKLKDLWMQELSVIQEQVRIHREKYEVYAKFGKTGETAVITGWVEEANKEKFRRHLDRLKYISVSFEEPDIEKDTVPSQLSHSEYMKPFEGLVNTFSPPKYNGLNPTPFVAVLFVLFTGMMLGDAGYGLIMLIGSILVRRKVKVGFMGSMAFIGTFVAIVTILTGIVTGAFFGDLLPRLIYGDPVAPLYPSFFIGPVKLPYDSLRNPMPFFLVGLGLGLVTIILSVVLSAITHVKQKDTKELVLGDIALLLLIPGMIILIIQLLGMIEMPVFVFYLGLGKIAGGMILLFVKHIKMPLLPLFEATGFLGDFLSFARILALGLATMGLAMTWNIIGEMILLPLGNSVVLIIIKLIVVLILLVLFHLFNFAFQTLGSCIHSLRLQYIEFFNRCYEGGGVLFSPFKAHRVFTEIEKK